MRITDPAWPAVQEAARMMLREDGDSILAPNDIHDSISELILKMGDTMPSRKTFPGLDSSKNDEILFFIAGNSTPSFYCGANPPSMNTLWLPFEGTSIWNTLKQSMFNLLDAGYPGCLGCGGTGAEEDWDEGASRTRMNVEITD